MKKGLWLICLLSMESALAALPLTDGPEGMTCSFHLASVRASWARRGGDWSDAAGVPYGSKPISAVTVTPTTNRQLVELDVTDLAKEWMQGGVPPGAVFLRPLGGGDGVVNFASRENNDVGARPKLIVEWDGGETVGLDAIADVTIDCTTIKSLGAGASLSVGGNTSTILVFPFGVELGKKVKKARLALSSHKQWGRGADIGVFRLTPPWAAKATPVKGIAALYPGDEGIQSDPAVFFASGFEERNWRDGWTTYGRASVADVVTADPSNQFVPLQGKALRVKLIPEQNLGLDLRYDFAKRHASEPDEAYMRYYLRFGESWNPTRDGGKLPGLAGTYNRGGWGLRKSDGTNGWSARGAFFSNRSTSPAMNGFTGVGSYVYHVDIENAQSVTWGWGMGPSGRFEKNKWYSVEQYVRVNDLGKKNGILRAWVDGHLVFERMDLHFRDVSDIKIENAWFNVYHGGVEKPPNEMALYIDGVVIAKKYIGPMILKSD